MFVAELNLPAPTLALNELKGFEMRKIKEKYTKKVTHWYCEKCKSLLHTKLRFIRLRCDYCGRFMTTIEESELAALRAELQEIFFNQK